MTLHRARLRSHSGHDASGERVAEILDEAVPIGTEYAVDPSRRLRVPAYNSDLRRTFEFDCIWVSKGFISGEPTYIPACCLDIDEVPL